MTHDDLAELMTEPPGGHNHGRRRGEGGWVSLETNGYDHGDLDEVIPDPLFGQGRRLRRSSEGIPHGTFGGYTNHRCRCDLCRAANREHQRRRRRSS